MSAIEWLKSVRGVRTSDTTATTREHTKSIWKLPSIGDLAMTLRDAILELDERVEHYGLACDMDDINRKERPKILPCKRCGEPTHDVLRPYLHEEMASPEGVCLSPFSWICPNCGTRGPWANAKNVALKNWNELMS